MHLPVIGRVLSFSVRPQDESWSPHITVIDVFGVNVRTELKFEVGGFCASDRRREWYIYVWKSLVISSPSLSLLVKLTGKLRQISGSETHCKLAPFTTSQWKVTDSPRQAYGGFRVLAVVKLRNTDVLLQTTGLHSLWAYTAERRTE